MFSVVVEYVASETKVWLHVDPLSVHIPSPNLVRLSTFAMLLIIIRDVLVLQVTSPSASPTNHDLGHVVISSIDLNCHGFTEFLCQERVEYSWMMQLLIGRLTGAVSSLQVRRYIHATTMLPSSAT